MSNTDKKGELVKPYQFNISDKEKVINRVLDNLLSQVDKELFKAVLNERGIVTQDADKGSREELITEVIEAYKAEGEFYDNYHADNEDCPMAQFVDSWGYEEGVTLKDVELMLSEEGDDECLEVIDKMLNTSFSQEQVLSLIKESCELVSASYYSLYYEVYRAQVGEQENQPSDELEEKFNQLTSAEKEIVKSKVDTCYVNTDGFFYTNGDTDQWVSQFDRDVFLELANERHGLKVS